MIEAAEQLGQEVGLVMACQVLGVSRRRLYREHQTTAPKEEEAKSDPKGSVRALSEAEREAVREELNSDPFRMRMKLEI
jgi:hypothetical protein